tara:strand:- start:3551 stop:4582 length:1032 start_codon:yes stop_codon:yes gene_type:complete
MPLELIADRPGHAILSEYDEPELAPGEVRVNSLFSSVKHGTELRGFRADTPDASDRWDRELGLHRRGEAVGDEFLRRLGNMCLGEVSAVGAEVDALQVGDRVFAHLPIRETHTIAAARLQKAPDGVSPQAIMYWDPADFAVGAVRDAPVHLGDRVAVFGLGAIGLMVAQLARICGARWVVAVDPIERRRQAAQRHGADLALDPTAVDAGLEIKQLTDKIGADIVFETSGNYRAFEDAMRSTCYGGTLVSTAYYHGDQGLRLAGEWHRNRINVRSSRACSEPLPQPGWDFARIRRESLALLVEDRLKADDLIDPIVPFAQAADAYREINEHPERSIKLGIDHLL